MRLSILLLSLIMSVFISTEITAQTEDTKPQLLNNWAFDFYGGVQARITPLYLNTTGFYQISPINYDENKLLTGLGLNAGFRVINRKSLLGFELSASYKNDHVYFERELDPNAPIGITKPTELDGERSLFDVHLGLVKYVPLRNNFLVIGAGFSFMNIGANYSFDYTDIDPSSNELVNLTQNHFLAYNSVYFDLAYQMNRVSIGLRVNYANNAQLPYGRRFILLEPRLTYNFSKPETLRKPKKL